MGGVGLVLWGIVCVNQGRGQNLSNGKSGWIDAHNSCLRGSEWEGVKVQKGGIFGDFSQIVLEACY